MVVLIQESRRPISFQVGRERFFDFEGSENEAHMRYYIVPMRDILLARLETWVSYSMSSQSRLLAREGVSLA